MTKTKINKPKLGESYIRLDALCYIINKFCLEKIPKSQEKGKIGGLCVWVFTVPPTPVIWFSSRGYLG